MSKYAPSRRLDVDWQCSKYRTLDRTKHMMETGLYSDCQFLVGADGSNQQFFKAHKNMLAMSSPVFAAMFFGTMTQSAGKNETIIPLPDLTPSSFKDLLKHIYTDTLDLQSIDQAIDLCYAAQKYILPDLVAGCLQYMLKNLCAAKTCKVLEFTKLCDDDRLKAKCLSLLRECTRESFASSDFEDYLSESTVLSIVKDGTLSIFELELFDAVLRWAKNQCAQRELEINRKNLREILSGIVGDIRFLAMKPEEFATSAGISVILSDEERTAVLINLKNPGSFPMALNLSSCKTPRERATIYCFRPLIAIRKIFVQEASVYSTADLSVDQDIFIRGFVFETMSLDKCWLDEHPDRLVIKCHLLGMAQQIGAKPLRSVTISQSLHRRNSVTCEAVFDRPLRLAQKKMYRLRVSVNQRVEFSSGMASTVLSDQGFRFNFNKESQNGLVRGVIFSSL